MSVAGEAGLGTSPEVQKQNFVEADDAISSATQREGFGAEETSSSIKAFGSPHMPTPPASPLDAAAKKLSFDAAKVPASPTTPGLSAAPGSATPVTPVGQMIHSFTDDAVDHDTFIKETLLWVNKVRSAVYLVGGLLLIYLAHRLFNSGISLITGVCYVVLFQAALNFARAFLSPKLQERCTWHDSAWTEATLHHSNNLVRGAAALHDRHLNGMDASKMLRIVGALWAISLAGRSMSLPGLAALLWVVAFIVPKLYMTFKPKVDKVVGDASQQVKTHFLRMDPKARAALVVVPVFVAGYALSSTDLAVAVLALLLYGRACMAPAQVEKLNSVVAPPINNTVKKVSGTVSKLMQNAATKFDLTPTPAKAKRA